MPNDLVIRDLRDRLDQIDRETLAKGGDKVRALRFLELHGMWRKGLAVLRVYPQLAKVEFRRGPPGVSAITFAAVAAETGRSDKTIAAWVKLYLAHPEERPFLAWAKEQAENALAKWQAHLLPGPKNNGGTPLPPEGEFSVILADPPWRYDFSPTDSRKVENQYPTMDVDEICTLRERVPLPFADDAVLFLWATAPKLLEALKVIDAWKFSYVTDAVWDKEIIGMGYWFRGQHELLLVATRGNFPPPPESVRVPSVIRSRRAEHSEKPVAVYELIEAAYPDQPRLEVFARNERDGWTPWGNEVMGAA